MVTRKMMGILCLIIAGLFADAQDTAVIQKLSLQQAVDIAIKNNLDVQQSDLAMQRARVGYRQAKANMLPNINGTVNHGINQGRSIDPFTNSYINQSLTNADYNLSGGIVALHKGFKY